MPRRGLLRVVACAADRHAGRANPVTRRHHSRCPRQVLKNGPTPVIIVDASRKCLSCFAAFTCCLDTRGGFVNDTGPAAGTRIDR
jgi:hypothetical protein